MSAQGRVSISTVLQAYRSLERSGLIEARPQSGYYVNGFADDERVVAPFHFPRTTPTIDQLVLEVLSRSREEGVISFATAHSTGAGTAYERVRRAWSACARRHPGALRQDSLPPGNEKLRRAISRRALEWGCHLDHRNLLTTSGCTEAVNLCLRAVTRPGDRVLVESPTSFGILHIIRSLGLTAVEIPSDRQYGISPSAVEQALEEFSVAAALLMPTISNPMGATLPDDAKRRLVSVLAARKVPLIEDHVFADLHFGKVAPRAAKSFDTDGNVLLCGSVSRTIAPGLKGGWVEAGRWTDKVRSLKLASSGGQPELVELTIAELLQSSGHDKALRVLRRRFQSSVLAARDVIAKHFPAQARVSDPVGGRVLWIEFPAGMDSLLLFERAAERGITIAPGPMFSASNQFRNCIRIGLSDAWTDRHAQSLREVGELAGRMLDP